MRRIIVLALPIHILILAGLITLRGDILALALPLVVYLLIGLWGAPEKLGISIKRVVSAERVTANTPVLVSLTASNKGSRLDEVLIEDGVSAALQIRQGSPRRLISLPAGGSFTWTYTIAGGRGYFPLSGVRVTANDHLALAQSRETIPTNGQLLVLPGLLRLRRIAIRPRQTRVYSGIIPARQGGAGIEFFGVREYQTGDPPRWINWRASARNPQALFSNAFEQERVADIGIILDGRQRSNILSQTNSMFEHSVTAAASLADAFLSSGNRVGLLIYGQYLHWTYPGYGRMQRERILQSLSHAATGYSAVFANFENIPTRLFPANSQMVLVSPLLADDLEVLIQLRSRGYQIMIISPDPIAFEQSGLSALPGIELAVRITRLERQALLNRLRRAGIQAVNWDVRVPFDRAVQSALGRSPAWLRAIRM